jgi:hypothetical protein
MIVVVLAAWALAQAVSTQMPPAPVDVRARVDAYERRLTRTRVQDPVELGDIARVVIEQARRSPRFVVWSEACGSTVVPDSDRCGPRLWQVLNRQTETLATRAEAASALLARGDTAAGDALADLLKTTRVSALAPLAPIIAELPARRAVPLLVRLAESASTQDQGLACRYLAAFDQDESRAAIRKVVGANPAGTEPWLWCMIGRERLHETNMPGAVLGYAHGLPAEGLLYAAQVMLDLGQEGAIQVLTDLTHRGSTIDRLTAATVLADRAPEVAEPVIDIALASADPRLRADGLSAERRLRREPSREVRAMLSDASDMVRIRAAEDVADWASREQKR